jgi:hypothetical protein
MHTREASCMRTDVEACVIKLRLKPAATRASLRRLLSTADTKRLATPVPIRAPPPKLAAPSGAWFGPPARTQLAASAGCTQPAAPTRKHPAGRAQPAAPMYHHMHINTSPTN